MVRSTRKGLIDAKHCVQSPGRVSNISVAASDRTSGLDQGRSTPETAQRARLTLETPLRTPGMAAFGTGYPWKCCAGMGHPCIYQRSYHAAPTPHPHIAFSFISDILFLSTEYDPKIQPYLSSICMSADVVACAFYILRRCTKNPSTSSLASN